MNQMNIPTYIQRWCHNFLQNRTFVIKMNEFITNYYTISADVPQGAVLSPLLFSIYINDIPCKNEKNKNYGLLFADDLVSYFIYRQKELVEKTINKYIQEIEIWLNKWHQKNATRVFLPKITTMS
jgi:hypothetical protein